MLSLFKNSKIQKNNILLLIMLSTNIFAQQIELSINANSNIEEAWWISNGNEGRGVSRNSLFSSYEGMNNNLSYQISTYLLNERLKIHESFIKYNFNDVSYLRIGKYYRDYSNYLNDVLSSGHMLISHNAQPMRKIGFVTAKKFNKTSLEGGISHAVFDKTIYYTEEPYLHEKFLYLHIVKDSYQYSIGFLHEAIWGGSIIEKGEQPDDFSDFLRVFISEDRKKEDYDIIPDTHLNALGNHLGLWEFVMQKKINFKLIKFYYQHFFEDTSGLRFRNEFDGLWGIEITNELVQSTILFEYLRFSKSLEDSYYNHGTYVEGWSYRNKTLGNPFIDHLNINPGEVLHLAVSGKIINDYNYELKISRRISRSDNLKYKISIGNKSEKLNKLMKPSFNIYVVNNELNQNGFGVEIYWSL